MIFLYFLVAGGTAIVAVVRPPSDEPCKQMLCLGGITIVIKGDVTLVLVIGC